VIEVKKTTGRCRKSYTEKIIYNAKIKTFKELKEKANSRSEWRIGVMQPSG
jgi:hypothetical protein